MYAVVRYYNYRKEVDVSILATFHTLESAREYAISCAEKDYGKDNVVNHIDNQWKYVTFYDTVEHYTTGTGYDENVFAVVKIPEVEQH